MTVLEFKNRPSEFPHRECYYSGKFLDVKEKALTTGIHRLISSMLKPERRKPYEPNSTDELGVSMVKDDGIYLMNIGVKDHWLNGPVKNFVVYADGFDPNLRAKTPDGHMFWRRHDGVWTDGDSEYESLPALQKETRAICNDPEHVFHEQQDAVGGDDFAHWIPLDREQVDQLLKSNDPQITIHWGKTSMKVETK